MAYTPNSYLPSPVNVTLNAEEAALNWAQPNAAMGFRDIESTPGYLAALKRLSNPATMNAMSGVEYVKTFGQQRPDGGVGASGVGIGVGGGVGGGAGVGGGGAPVGGGAGIEQITQLVNEINQRAQQSANAGRVPGGAGLEQQSSGNIGSALRGEVDPSTMNLLGQQAAERGASTGSPMGPGSNADYLRSLGLTSLDRMNTGQGWLSAATARNPAAPIYDAGNQVLTAAQLQQAILAREQMANQLRIAQMNAANRRGGGGGGGGPRSSAPPISSSASNWQPLFGPDQQVPTPTPSTPQPNPAFYNDFQSRGGTYGGMNLGTPDQPITPGVPVPPYQMPFSTNWEGMIDDVQNNQDYSDLEDFVYRDGGG